MPPAKPNQTEFFVISDVAQIGPNLQFDAQEHGDETAVGLVTRSILLQNTIANLQQAQYLDTIVGLAPIVRNSRAKAGQLKYDAQTMFIRASGSDRLSESEYFSPREIRTAEASGQQLFTDFMRKYFLRKHPKDPQEYKLDLIAEVLILQSESNRTQNLRPHKATRHEEKEAPEEITDTLDEPARLQALLDDPRAGFFPTTRQEKNQLISYLDYLDNPKFPLRLTNRFIEIYNYTQAIRRRPNSDQHDPKRGPVSIAFEIGDFYQDALRSRQALQDLEKLLYECLSPNITLGEETDIIRIDHPGYDALIRYLDIRSFFKTGRGVVVADPLVTKTDRWDNEKPVRHTRKRKMIGDIYNPHFTTPEVGARITKAVRNLNVADAREVISVALQDQMRRESYLRLILTKFAVPPEETPTVLLRELSASRRIATSILEVGVASQYT